jgi:hypothetical protein
MSGNNKMPVRLSHLARTYATHKTMHPQPGDLPGAVVMDFSRADGPAAVHDGRDLRAMLSPGELAEVLGAIPALSLDSTGSLMALTAVTDMLEGLRSRFTGVRVDDLRAIIVLAGTVAEYANDDQRRALDRIRESAGNAANGKQETSPS